MINPANRTDDDIADRDMILLALAQLAILRPGWDWTLGRLAERFNGRATFDAFKETLDDH